MGDDSKSPAPSTPTTPGDDAFRTLALRLLAMSPVQFGSMAPRGNVQVLAAQIAPEFPSDVPLPSESRVVGSFLSSYAHGRQVIVVFDCDLSLEQLDDFYQERLPAIGWFRDEPPNGPSAGFERPHVGRPASGRVGPNRVVGPFGSVESLHVEYGQTNDAGRHLRGLHINGTSSEEGAPTDARLTLVQHDPSFPFRDRGRMAQPMPAHLPVFTPPPDAGQEPEGSSYASAGRFDSRARLWVTGSNVAAMARHYSAQLERIGWTSSDAGTDGPVCWSTWTLTDLQGEPWRAELFVIQLPPTPEHYVLRFHATTVRPDAYGGKPGTFGIGWGG